MKFKKWLSVNFTEREEKDGVYKNDKTGKYNSKEHLEHLFKLLKTIDYDTIRSRKIFKQS